MTLVLVCSIDRGVWEFGNGGSLLYSILKERYGKDVPALRLMTNGDQIEVWAVG